MRRADIRRKAWRLFVEAGWSFERVRSWLKRVHGIDKGRAFVEELIREEWRRGKANT